MIENSERACRSLKKAISEVIIRFEKTIPLLTTNREFCILKQMKKNESKVLPFFKIEIAGKRLLLRPYKLSDFKALCASHRSRIPSADKFDEPIVTANESDCEKFRQRIHRHRSNGKDGEDFIFGVFDKKTGVHIGQVDLFTINKQLRWANIGVRDGGVDKCRPQVAGLQTSPAHLQGWAAQQVAPIVQPAQKVCLLGRPTSGSTDVLHDPVRAAPS